MPDFKEEKSKAIDLDTAVAMIKTAHGIPPDPEFDEESGRYTNESILEWIEARRDGLIYGVKIPKYEYNPTTSAVKTDANAGLILEPSTNETAGRNDYLNKALFMCPRVNGGVDADGMPYITAIEDLDDRFDCETENTWALTPVYYVKRTVTEEYTWQQYSDTKLEGFEPCAGAFTSTGIKRPYILRACYMDSDGNCTSKSGTTPAAAIAPNVEGSFAHCFKNDIAVVSERNDGLSFLSYGDVTYHIEFMQLMLGVKAPGVVAKGYTLNVPDYLSTCNSVASARELNVLNGARYYQVGDYINAGDTYPGIDSIGAYNRLRSAQILDIRTDPSNANLAIIKIDRDHPTSVSPSNSSKIWISPPRNGAHDDVLGTYGCFAENGLTDGRHSFKFQNIEMGLGFFELCANMISSDKVVYVAPSIKECTYPPSISTSEWVSLGATPDCNVNGKYIRDYTCKNEARLPYSLDGTSTTGYRVKFWSDTGVCECLVNGTVGGPTDAGIGCMGLNVDLDAASYLYGSRASAIGISSL